jgi:hypothetical protein
VSVISRGLQKCGLRSNLDQKIFTHTSLTANTKKEIIHIVVTMASIILGLNFWHQTGFIPNVATGTYTLSQHSDTKMKDAMGSVLTTHHTIIIYDIKINFVFRKSGLQEQNFIFSKAFSLKIKKIQPFLLKCRLFSWSSRRIKWFPYFHAKVYFNKVDYNFAVLITSF